jgi:hypothetical protein
MMTEANHMQHQENCQSIQKHQQKSHKLQKRIHKWMKRKEKSYRTEIHKLLYGQKILKLSQITSSFQEIITKFATGGA